MYTSAKRALVVALLMATVVTVFSGNTCTSTKAGSGLCALGSGSSGNFADVAGGVWMPPTTMTGTFGTAVGSYSCNNKATWRMTSPNTTTTMKDAVIAFYTITKACSGPTVQVNKPFIVCCNINGGTVQIYFTQAASDPAPGCTTNCIRSYTNAFLI